LKIKYTTGRERIIGQLSKNQSTQLIIDDQPELIALLRRSKNCLVVEVYKHILSHDRVTH
jgi:hypothetical protein